MEKNGLWAVFLLFWVFTLIRDYISSGTFVLNYSFWFYGALATSIIYLILKVVKSNGQDV